MWTILKVFIEFVTLLLLLFMFCFFGIQACGLLAPWPGMEPAPPVLEGEVLTTGPAREVSSTIIWHPATPNAITESSSVLTFPNIGWAYRTGHLYWAPQWWPSHSWISDSFGLWASLVAQTVKNLSAMGETHAQSLGREDPLEKGMAIPSSILAWRILWTENPGRLQSMGCKELDLTEQLTHFIYDVSYWWSWGAQSSDWFSAH